MKNHANFEMLVVGEQANVERFYRQIAESDMCSGLYAREFGKRADGYHSISSGDFDWRDSCLVESGDWRTAILALCAQLCLSAEVFSYDTERCSVEHLAVRHNDVLCDEIYDLLEVRKEDIENGNVSDDFWELPFVVEFGMTKENYPDFFADTDCIRISGCPIKWTYF